MIKQRFNTTFIIFLLIAFLAAMWTPSHAHLNAQHDHGGERHQHSIKAHTHQSVTYHADLIDSDHLQMEESKVVDLDHDQHFPNSKKGNNPSALVAYIYYFPLIQSREIILPECYISPSRQHHSHPGQPRAPPLLS